MSHNIPLADLSEVGIARVKHCLKWVQKGGIMSPHSKEKPMKEYKIRLPENLEEYVKEHMDYGRYASANEFFRAVLLRDRYHFEQQKLRDKLWD